LVYYTGISNLTSVYTTFTSKLISLVNVTPLPMFAVLLEASLETICGNLPHEQQSTGVGIQETASDFMSMVT
jgi:hypothetical protein